MTGFVYFVSNLSLPWIFFHVTHKNNQDNVLLLGHEDVMSQSKITMISWVKLAY